MRPLALLVFVLLAFPAAGVAAPGGADLGFGRLGIARTVVEDGAIPTFVAQQPSGRIVVGAWVSNLIGAPGSRSYAVVGFTADGRRDLGFGRGGIVGGDGAPDGTVAMKPDGSLVLAQLVDDGRTLRLRALTRDGQADPRFRTTDVRVPRAQPSDVTLRLAPDGGVVAGIPVQGRTILGDGAIGLVRYTAAGDPDPGFGDGGQVTLDVHPDALVRFAFGVQRSGRVVVLSDRWGGSGLGVEGATLFGVGPDGRLDPAFGDRGDGTSTRPGAFYGSLGIGPDDEVVVLGDAPGDNGFGQILRRLGPDATGTDVTPVPTSTGTPRGVLMTFDSRGAAYAASGSGVARIGRAGLDTTFGTARNPMLHGLPIALQQDGRVLVAPVTEHAISVTRFWGGYDSTRPVVRLATSCRGRRALLAIEVTDESPLAEVEVRSGKRLLHRGQRLRLRVPRGQRVVVRVLDSSGNQGRAAVRARRCGVR